MRIHPYAAAMVAILLPQPALAWGDKGHEIIANIARDRLTRSARAWVDAIIAKDTDTLTAFDMVARATCVDQRRKRDRGRF